MQGKSEKFSAGDFSGITLSSTTYPKISPTLFKNKEFFGVSLNGGGAGRLLGGKAKALTEQELLGGIKPGGDLQHIGFMRLDEITGRSYKLLKPYLTDYLHKSEDADMQHLADKLPGELAMAKLLGSWHAAGWQKGDIRAGELRSPVGSGVFAAGFGAGLAVPVIYKAYRVEEKNKIAAAAQARQNSNPEPAEAAAPASPEATPVQSAPAAVAPAQ
jgi:hypothetical protein